MVLGTGNPFVASESTFQIERGRQGGYHIEVSLRVMGAMDPDAVDIVIRLRNARRVVATHTQTDWLLRINTEGPHCEYLVALLVLLDEDGGLLLPDAFAAEVDDAMQIEVELLSPQGNALASFPVRLLAPPPEGE